MSAYVSMRKAGVNYTKPGGTAGNEIILSQQSFLCWDFFCEISPSGR
ncbi:MAG: hypothetical protein IJ054_06290 [Lachnospiraceae bacterium]|nr:hypothetical protein [Lachnospiraceae bacterium]